MNIKRRPLSSQEMSAVRASRTIEDLQARLRPGVSPQTEVLLRFDRESLVLVANGPLAITDEHGEPRYLEGPSEEGGGVEHTLWFGSPPPGLKIVAGDALFSLDLRPSG